MACTKRKVIDFITIIILPFFIIFLHCNSYRKIVQYGFRDQSLMTIEKCMEEFFEGVPLIAGKDAASLFHIPALWFSFFLGFFIICAYMAYFKINHEQQVMYRQASRKAWWRKKVISLFLITIVYVCAAFLSFIIWGLMMGMEMNGINISIIRVFVFSTLILFYSGLLQHVVSLKWNPAIGLILSVGIFSVSFFIMTPLLPANYVMLVRWEVIKHIESPINNGLIVCIVVTVLLYFAGEMISKKKDWF